jgi:hypothetical protein
MNYWPSRLIKLGFIAGVFMLIGILGLYGVVKGIDGHTYSNMVIGIGVSYIGFGILFPIWNLWLGSWILFRRTRVESVV